MREVEENYSPVQLEKGIKDRWEKNRTYEAVRKSHESDRPYYFLDGPPYTTGSIHIGTAWNKILKDTVIRFRRMQGFNVRDQPGFDMHGLPIEVKVEQSLGFKSKKEIESHGMDKFVETCKEFALKFKAKMTDEFRALGVWMDWDDPYLTVDPSYIASVWWTVKQAYDKQLLTMDLRVLPWCPRCETALAEAEIEYWDETDPSIYVRFPIEGAPGEHLLIWTTTPWTIPGNLAAAVHPDLTYARVRVVRGEFEEGLILLEDKVEELKKFAEVDDIEVLETFKGSELVGMHYQHPLAEFVPYQQEVKGEWVHAVVSSPSVTAESTGIVHIAPGHGPEDFDIGKEHGLEPFSPVDETGAYTEEVGERYAGRNVRASNDMVMRDLVDKGVMFHQADVTHRYGHCWRCHTPVIYRITDQLFLKVSQIRDELMAANDQVVWYPDWAGSSREKEWIQNARDWCISRQRYWGTPVPLWVCKCGNTRVVSSVEELKQAKGYVPGMDLHRPWIDSLVFLCEKCNGDMTRLPDVLDVWFDAGVCSWASLGYPASNEEFDRLWPSEWITEAHDQTRGWFYSQLVTGVVAFGRSPYKSVLMHGWARTAQGQAMSKSDGTAVDPMGIVNTMGADSLRLYLMKANAPWEDLEFQEEGVKAANRSLNIFWNVYKFASLYMSIDKFDPSSVRLARMKDSLRPEDFWMLSRLESVKDAVTSAMNAYEPHKAARAVEDFVVEDLSRWYVKLVRGRLWKEGEDDDKHVAFKILHLALTTSAKLLAPMCPYISEAVFTNLETRPESVHMASWPERDPQWEDKRLEEGMALVREASETIARIRQEANLNLRWPLKRLVVKADSAETLETLVSLRDILLSQNNIKEMDVVPVGEEWEDLVLTVVPNPNAIGMVYRQWSSKIAVLLKNRPAKSIKAGIDKGEYSLGIEGQLVKILPDMVSFTYTLPPGIAGAEFSKGAIYVDLEQTPALEAEGFAREAIRRIQQMRKDMKLDVEEYVKAEVECSRKMESAIDAWREHIAKETRAERLDIVDSPKGEYVVEWSVAGESMQVGLSPVSPREAREMPVEKPAPPPAVVLPPPLVEEPVPEPAGQPEPEPEAAPVPEAAPEPPSSEQLAEEAAPEEPTEVPEAPGEEQKPPAAPEKTFEEELLGIEGMSEDVTKALAGAGYGSSEALRSATLGDLTAVPGMSVTLAVELIRRYGDVREPPAEAPRTVPKLAEGGDELERSFTYLVEEDRPETSYKLFVNALGRGMKGYCVTRNYPAKIKSRFDLGETPVIWLSNVGRENTIRPKDLEKLSLSLEQFLSQPGGGIVLLDGLEYLITNNNFITVLRLIQALRDQVAINQSILLMAVNRSTLESHQLNLLEREVDHTISG